jgi:hypothetical protein
MKPHIDVFAEAREKYSIPDLWQALGLPGEPKPSCKSPFREDKQPSFSIFDNGKAWCDHATGQGGDVIEFLCAALQIDHREARDWFGERLGIDFHDGPARPRTHKPSPTPPAKEIEWPAELLTGTPETWKAFAAKRGYAYPSVCVMVQAGFLRFSVVNGHKCFVVTDPSKRTGEIRRIDGGLFGQSKAYPLKGVDKSWPLGAAYLDDESASPNVFITEGATDFLAALDLLTRYRRAGGLHSWTPLAILGANCRRLDPDAAQRLRGKHCRLAPDADKAGQTMRETWTALLNSNGCPVDCLELPDGTDLTDNLHSLNTNTIFSR